MRTSAVYFVGMTLTKMATVLLLPIYTRVVRPDDFGSFDFWTTLVSFVGPIAFVQVWDATYRYHFRDDSDSTALATTGFAIMCVGIAVFLLTVLPILIFSGAEFTPELLLFGLTLSAQYFLGYFARAEFKNLLFAQSGIANTAINAGATLVLLNAGWGVRALYLGLVLGNITQCAVLLAFLRPWRMLALEKLDIQLARSLMAFAMPLCLASVAYWLLSGYSRFVTIHLIDSTANGYLAIGFRFAMVVTVLTTVLIYAWNELLYSSHGEDHSKNTQRQGGRLALSAGLTAAAATIGASGLAFDSVVGPTYIGARDVVPIVVMATVANSISSILASIFLAEGETRGVFRSTLVAATVNIFLAWLGAELFGVFGVALALLVSFMVMTTMRIRELAKQYQVSVFSGAACVAGVFLAAVNLCYFAEPSTWVTLCVLVVGLAVSGGAIVRGRKVADM